jgi:apolipoprotein D and lipocalin family protein
MLFIAPNSKLGLEILFMVSRIVFALMLMVSATSAFALFGIKTVSTLEPLKFVGTWYRISSKPIIFEPACACARQVLNANADGTVGVYNSCDKKVLGGELVEIGGYAQPVDQTFTKLAVHFKGVPFAGSYWVVALDSQYRWTVVSDKFGYSLYVMSREPQLSSDLYAAAVAAAAANGAPTTKLKMQVQEGCSYPPVR